MFSSPKLQSLVSFAFFVTAFLMGGWILTYSRLLGAVFIAVFLVAGIVILNRIRCPFCSSRLAG